MPDRLAALNELIAELEAEQKRPGGDTIAAWRHLMDLRRESGPRGPDQPPEVAAAAPGGGGRANGPEHHAAPRPVADEREGEVGIHRQIRAGGVFAPAYGTALRCATRPASRRHSASSSGGTSAPSATPGGPRSAPSRRFARHRPVSNRRMPGKRKGPRHPLDGRGKAAASPSPNDFWHAAKARIPGRLRELSLPCLGVTKTKVDSAGASTPG